MKRVFSIGLSLMITAILTLSGVSFTIAKKNTSASAMSTAVAATITKTNVTIWHSNDALAGGLRKALDKFEAKNPTIKVTLVKQNDVAQKLTLTGGSSEAPDLIIGANDFIGKFQIMDLIEPITNTVSTASLQELNPMTVNAVSYKGKIYGVPLSYETLILMYNKKLLKAAPKTTDELLSVAKNGIKGDKWGFLYDVQAPYFQMGWIYGNNGSVLNASGMPKINEPNTIQALELVRKFMQYGPKNYDVSVADGLFKEGKVAVTINGPWSLNDYRNDKKIDLGVELLPIISKTGKRAQPYLGVISAMMVKASQNKTAAASVLKFLATTEVGKAIADTGSLAANKNIDLSKDLIAKKFAEQIKYSVPMPTAPEISSVWNPMINALRSIQLDYKNADIKAIMNKAQKEVEDNLANQK
jgi:arabinogalactan oligomer / maltooligosaccharide transport system substrate-binding protein